MKQLLRLAATAWVELSIARVPWLQSIAAASVQACSLRRMIKRTTLFFGLFLVLGIHRADARESQLHIIYLIDTEAGKVGDDISTGDKADQDMIDTIIGEVFSGSRRNRLGSYQVVEGDALTPERIRSSITRENLQVEDDDAVWVYYAGHGIVRSDKHILATSGGEIRRDEVRKLLLGLKVRLAVLITDTCSSFPGQVSVAPRRVPADWAAFSDLFFKSSGLVDFTAASTGEFAWSTDEGGFFTRSFSRLFCEPKQFWHLSDDEPLTWKTFFAQARTDTNMLFQAVKTKAVDGANIRGSDSQLPSYWFLADHVDWSYPVHINNELGESLHFCLQAFAYNSDSRSWNWTPVYEWEVPSGNDSGLKVDEWKVTGNQFRWWASTDSGMHYGNKYGVFTFNAPHRAGDDSEYVLRFAN